MTTYNFSGSDGPSRIVRVYGYTGGYGATPLKPVFDASTCPCCDKRLAENEDEGTHARRISNEMNMRSWRCPECDDLYGDHYDD